jgi:1-acyl-sn-glycerol-3-phosphate acyltransferase
MLTILKNIFARIWAVWGFLWFITTLFIILIPVMLTGLLKEPKKSRVFWKLSQLWMQLYLPFVGCFLRVTGKEVFKKDNCYVVVSNHNSLLDVPLTSPFIPGPNRTIAKKDFMKIPVFNVIYRRGSVLVDRKSEASRRESFSKMKEALANNFHVCIYPEGTRNKTGQPPIQPFKDGAFRLAAETGNAIIPCVLFNTAKALPPAKPFYMLPHRLYMHFLPPVPVDGLNAVALKEKVFQVMEDFYTTHQSNPKNILCTAR